MAARLQVVIPRGYALVFDKKEMRKIMRAAGAELAQTARSLIRRATRGNKGIPSAPGQPPHSVTGQLVGGITSRAMRSGDGVTVRDRVFYALFLEAGARGGAGSGRGRTKALGSRGIRRAHGAKQRVLEPRPFLTKALDLRKDSLEKRVTAAIVEGIEFKRAKV